MFTVGITAEFDPFHKGHEYLIAQARERGATHIVAAMSGAAVQRGQCALCSKHFRAETAVNCGADLVIELPAPYSCSSAERFAYSAVQILVQFGINALAFGSEYDNKQLLYKAAEAAQALKDSELVRKGLKEGRSYPAAVAHAAQVGYGSAVSDVLSSPNSTLAGEYIRALKQLAPDKTILPIKRIGAAHDSSTPAENGYASGSFLRAAMLSQSDTALSQYTDDIKRFFPENAVPNEISRPNDAEKIMLYTLINADKQSLMMLPDMNDALANRITDCCTDPPHTLGELLLNIKNRTLTLARLRRTALALTLGITADDLKIPVPYLRVLAFNKRGAELLSGKGISLPISTSLKTLERSSSSAQRIIAIENRAVRLQQLGMSSFDNEYTRKISIL